MQTPAAGGFIAPHAVDQRVGAYKGRGKAVLDGFDAQAGGQMCFTHARWSQYEHDFLAAHEFGGGQQVDWAAVDTPLEFEVEALKRLAHRQTGQLQTGSHPALLARVLFPLAEQVQERRQGQLLLDRLFQDFG